MKSRFHTGITLCFRGVQQSVLLLVFIRTIGMNVEFCKADSGEKPQEIVGFDGAVFIYIISVESRCLGVREDSNTRNFPD